MNRSRRAWPLIALLPGAVLAQEAPPAWLAGSWRDAEGRYLVRFEEGRLALHAAGRLSFTRARYAPDGRIGVLVQGAVEAIAVSRQGEAIELDLGPLVEAPSDLRLERAGADPPQLRLDPFPLPPLPPAPSPERIAALQTELARRVEVDQAVRTDRSRAGEMARVDADNTAWLKEQLAELGWIDAVRFGPRASDAAFLLVQHSGDLPLMLASLPPIEADVRAKRLGGQPFALLHDRLALALGRTQRYGSQVGLGPAGPTLLPLEDPGRVDERRAELGLGPLREYLAWFEEDGVKVAVPERDPLEAWAEEASR